MTGEFRARYRVIRTSRWVLFKAFLRGEYAERWSPWGGAVNDQEFYE